MTDPEKTKTDLDVNCLCLSCGHSLTSGTEQLPMYTEVYKSDNTINASVIQNIIIFILHW